MASLDLGPTAPQSITIGYVLGDASWSASIVWKVDGVAAAWPGVPVIEFDNDVTWTPTVSESGTKATWTANQAQVAAINALPNKRVKLTLDGMTLFVGETVRRG